MADNVTPSGLPRRSFVQRKLSEATFVAVGDAAVAADIGGKGAVTLARRMALVDLSPLPRTGFKGPGALAWLGQQKTPAPDTDNTAGVLDDGTLVARLAPSEALLLGDPLGEAAAIARLDGKEADGFAAEAYRVPRRDTNAWFRLTGRQAAACMAKLCGVDLRADSFADLAVAQTQVARLSAIVIRQDLTGGRTAVPAFHLLFDSASAEYLWDVLVDAMAEFDGGPAGLDALKALSEPPAKGKPARSRAKGRRSR
jgi:sarcosine oxidase subunit gamma